MSISQKKKIIKIKSKLFILLRKSLHLNNEKRKKEFTVVYFYIFQLALLCFCKNIKFKENDPVVHKKQKNHLSNWIRKTKKN